MIGDRPSRGPGGGELPLWKRLLKVASVILGVSLATYALVQLGWLRGFETAVLDTWVRTRIPLKAPSLSQNIVIVGIYDDDYQKHFEATSPLNPRKLAEIINAIAKGRPKVIAVDLDTSDPRFRNIQLRNIQPAPQQPSIVWAQDAVRRGGREGEFEPLEVLGGKKPAPGVSGIALLPQDPDGIVRSYRRKFNTMDSFPWAVVKAFRGNVKQNEESEGAFILNFAGDRYRFPHYKASHVLDASTGEGWESQGPLNDKIVLLGGLYRVARDEYITPIGPMAGVELTAQVIESELHGGGIRGAHKALMWLLNMLGGTAMVIVFRRFRLGTAFVVSLAAMPILALLFSLAAFKSLAYWTYFLIILIALPVYELYNRAKSYQNMLIQQPFNRLEDHRQSDETPSKTSIEH